MNAKKCDRCGSFYVEKELKTDNAVDICGKKVFVISFKYRSDGCNYDYWVDLCPKCMNDLKIFMEIQHITPYVVTDEDDAEIEDPCHGCVDPHCEQCTYGYKSLEERIKIAKEG